MVSKIGFLAEQLSSGAGTDRYARSLAESVSAHASVRVLTMAGARNETVLSDVRAVLPKPRFHPLAQLRVFWQVVLHMRDREVIHCLIEHYSPGAALAGHMLGIPVTMTLHGTYAVPPRRGLKFLMMRYAYSRMPLVTSGSSATAQKTREVVPIGECRIIPNGVNFERFHILPNTKRAQLMLTVGALKARKGVDLAIRAMAVLKDKYPMFRYAVVGDDAHDSFSHSVHELAETSGLANRIDFYQGISDTRLLELYNEAFAFVLAARETEDGAFEGFPMVYYEANACGTPVITTTGFGSEYAIRDGENGFLVPPEDPGALANALEKLLDDSARWSLMSEASRVQAADHTWDKIADVLMQFYDDVIMRHIRP